MTMRSHDRTAGSVHRRALRPRLARSGSALVIALVVALLAAVVALAGARGTAFGLRIAQAGVLRVQLLAAAENALERALAAPLPVGLAAATSRVAPDGTTVVDVEVARDRRTPLGPAPGDGWSIGLAGAGFGAEHYTARATALGRRDAQAIVEQQFHLLVPEGP